MGFPTRACSEPASDEAMKQSLRLVKEVSLSMSWNMESFPVENYKRLNSSMISVCSKSFQWLIVHFSLYIIITFFGKLLNTILPLIVIMP